MNKTEPFCKDTTSIVSMIIEKCSRRHFKRLETFHPGGIPLLNGVYVYKGFYFEQCRENAQAFAPCNQDNLTADIYPGGIILFPCNTWANALDNNIATKIECFIASLSEKYSNRTISSLIFGGMRKYIDEKHFLFEIGNAFRGRYKSSPQGYQFSSLSLTIQADGLTRKGLLLLAEFLAKSLNQNCVLVRTSQKCNKNKFIS